MYLNWVWLSNTTNIGGKMETGNILVLSNAVHKTTHKFIIEKNGRQIVLGLLENPYKRLHITEEGPVSWRTVPPSRSCTFFVEEEEEDASTCSKNLPSRGVSPTVIRLKVERANQKKGNRGKIPANDVSTKAKASSASCTVSADAPSSLFLCVHGDGSLHGTAAGSKSDAGSQFTVAFEKLQREVLEQSTQPVRTIFAAKWQIQRLISEGYVSFPAVIEPSKSSACLIRLNNYLGVPDTIVAGGVQQQGIGKFKGEVSNCVEVKELLVGNVARLLDNLLGAENWENSNLSAQIAFRFPELTAPTEGTSLCSDAGNSNSSSRSSSSSRTQAVGVQWHTDGLRQGKQHPFSLLVGVCLSDVNADFSGNLAVWPRSHVLLHQCKHGLHGALDLEKFCQIVGDINSDFEEFRHEGKVQIDSAKGVAATPCASVNVNASESIDSTIKDFHDNEPPLPYLGEPLQLKLNVGDVVVLHPDLAHGGAPNFSSDIRRMLYFRIKIKCCTAAYCMREKKENCDVRIQQQAMTGNTAASVDGISVEGSRMKSSRITLGEGEGEKGVKEQEQRKVKCRSWKDIEEAHLENMWVDISAADTLLSRRRAAAAAAATATVEKG